MNIKVKKSSKKQIYEYYWDLTMAWTDFNGDKFLNALKICIDFIKNNNEDYSPKVYNTLQRELVSVLKLNNLASIRKGINELVKLGFINSQLKSYHPLSEDYIQAQNNQDRKFLFSKIVYSNASFQRSVTKESKTREINFLIKTLEEQKRIDKKYLGSMISINTADYPAGYITFEELEKVFRREEQAEFERRKYNQISYLEGLLKKLDGISFKGNYLYLKKDSNDIKLEEQQDTQSKGRDLYLQRIYKHQLERESIAIFGKVKCMVENLAYPVLIASHIKPFRMSNPEEAFDPNNGLLLSRTLDSLFDLNYISFDDDGSVIFYNKLDNDVKNFWKNYKIKKEFLTTKRLSYLRQHRDLCNKKLQ